MKITREEAIKLLSQILPDFEIEIVDEFETETREELPVIVKAEKKTPGIIPLNEHEELDVKERRALFLDLYYGLVLEKKIPKISKKTMFHFEEYQNYGQKFQDWNIHEWQEFFFKLLNDDTALEARTRQYRPTDWLLNQMLQSSFIAADKLPEGKK